MVASSRLPRKQRKRHFTKALHERAKCMAAHLDEKLSGQFNRRSVTVRVGDTVKIVRGEFKGTKGKVERVDRKTFRLFIEGIQRERADGTKRAYPIHPSNVLITELDIKDRIRQKAIGGE